jgi:hypothetical protein
MLTVLASPGQLVWGWLCLDGDTVRARRMPAQRGAARPGAGGRQAVTSSQTLQASTRRMPSSVGGAVPQHQPLARQVPQQVLEEAHHVRAAQGVLARVRQQPAVRRDGPDDRQVVAGQPHAQDRRLPPRSGASETAG